MNGLGRLVLALGFDTLLCPGLETGGNNRNTQLLAQAFFMAISPNDVGGKAGLILDVIGDIADLVHGHLFGTGCDVHEDVTSTLDVVVVQQRRGKRLLDCLDGTVITFRDGGTHDRNTGILYGGLHVFEIDVDVSRHGDDLRDAFRRGGENVISVRECFGKVEVAEHFTEFLVADDEDGIDTLLELLDTVISLLFPLLAFELERNGDDRDRQDPHLASCLRDDRRGARSGSSAHARSDEYHLRVIEQQSTDILDTFDRRITANLRNRTGTAAVRQT